MLRKAATFWRALAQRLRKLWRSPAGTSAGAERRQWARYPSIARTTCRPAAGAEPTGLRARVRDVSFGGINLLVGRPLDAGVLLHVDLPEGPREAPSLLACIVQVTAPRETAWSLGCSFIRELNEQELRHFL